jgi:predicted ferric reductase
MYELCTSFMKSAAVKKWLFAHLYPHLVKRGSMNPPVSWANIITQFLYWAGTAVFNTVGINNLQDGSNRAMSLTAFNFIPLLLSDRLAFAADLLDLSSRTVTQIHNSVGIMTVVQVTLHFILQTLSVGLHLSQTKELYSFLVSQNLPAAYAATNFTKAAIALIVLALLTMPLCRAYLYEVFLKTHLALSMLALYAIWRRLGPGIHQNHIFLLIASGIYTSTAALRTVRTLHNSFSWSSGWSRAEIKKYHEATCLSISLPRARKFQAGQYIYLWAPGVSFTSIFQSHPYIVTWWNENTEGLTDHISILVKTQSGFSRDLQTLSSGQGQLLVNVDGPYGRGLNTSPFATLVLLATGIGITTQISLAKSAMKEMKASRNALCRISIIWQMDQECKSDASVTSHGPRPNRFRS